MALAAFGHEFDDIEPAYYGMVFRLSWYCFRYFFFYLRMPPPISSFRLFPPQLFYLSESQSLQCIYNRMSLETFLTRADFSRTIH